MLKFLTAALVGLTIVIVMWPDPAPDKRILFIGNSYTFGGQVPLQVKNIAATSVPPATYAVEQVVRGGTTLEQHIAETDALATIQGGDWDVVVLQDASIMPFYPPWVDRMTTAATILADAATQNGAQVLYFAHWAPVTEIDNRPEAIETIERAYSRLARSTGGTVARAGRMWQMADDAGLDGLYAADDHHSTNKGAYAAALAIVAALGDVDPSTSSWAPDTVPAAQQDQLRAAAAALRGVLPNTP